MDMRTLHLPGCSADIKVEFSTQAASDPDHLAQIVAIVDGTYAALPTTARLTWDAALRSGNDAQPSPFTLQVTNGQTKIAAQGMLLDPISPTRANLTMTMSGPDMALLKPLIGATLPSTPAYTVEVGMDYADGLYRITGNAGRVGQSDLEGAITVRTGGNQPLDVTADLSSRDATIKDLAAVIANQRHSDGEIPAKGGSQLFLRGTLAVAAARRRRFTSDISGADRPRHVDNSSATWTLHAELGGGALTLRPFSVGIGQGKLTGDLLFAPQAGGAMRGQADVRLDGVGLDTLDGPDKISRGGDTERHDTSDRNG